MMDFKDFTKGFHDSPSPSPRKPGTPRPAVNAAPGKRQQLRGQIGGIIQELLNLPALSDTDRRLLNIASALAYLLAGGRS